MVHSSSEPSPKKAKDTATGDTVSPFLLKIINVSFV